MGVYSKDGIGYPKRNMETYNFTELSKRRYWYRPTDWKNVEITRFEGTPKIRTTRCSREQ
jgi:hypothetical protein